MAPSRNTTSSAHDRYTTGTRCTTPTLLPVTIPNSKFFTDITSSGNYGELDMMVVVDFHIGADQDVRRAREVVREIAITSRFVFLEKDVKVTAKQVVVENYVAVRLCLKLYVLDTRHEKALETDITLRVLEAFASESIEPPAILHRQAAHADWPGERVQG